MGKTTLVMKFISHSESGRENLQRKILVENYGEFVLDLTECEELAYLRTLS